MNRMQGSRPTALVTGASRGIGKAAAIVLAERGFDVAITARTVKAAQDSPSTSVSSPMGSLEETAREIEQRGGRAIVVALDLLDRAALRPAVDRAIEGLGSIDVLVNNAIFVSEGGPAKFLDTSPDEIDNRVFANLTAQMHITQHVLRHMVQRGIGCIVNVTSGAGHATPARPAGEGGWALTYAASKAGFHRIADMIALEYGSNGIRAYNINPGFVATERVLNTPELAFVAAKGVTPRFVAEAIANLIASDTPNGSYVQGGPGR